MSEIQIKRVLVVDDSPENLEAARKFFKSVEGVEVIFFTDSQKAKEAISDAYHRQEKYDLVITDLEMETEFAGMSVARTAVEHQVMPFIVTGKAGSGSHGPSISVEPARVSVSGLKSDVVVWEKIWQVILDYLSRDGRAIYLSLARYYEYIGKSSQSISELFLHLFPNNFRR